MRILVTGSRAWDDHTAVWAALDAAVDGQREVTVVHGACPRGADAWAAQWCEEFAAYYDNLGIAVSEERHPADWQGYGKRAGFIRNAEMAAAGADLCLAFIKDGSAGAAHCAVQADNAGIPVKRWTA